MLNTGVSTEGPLRRAGERLEADGLRYAFLRLGEAGQRLPADLLGQGWGTHADEHEMIETSQHRDLRPGGQITADGKVISESGRFLNDSRPQP